VPTAYDNIKDPTPVTVWLREPTERQRREIAAFGQTIRVTGDKDNPTLTLDAVDDLAQQHQAVESCVEKVENYTACFTAPDGAIETIEITNGELLARYGEQLFVYEAAMQVLRAATPSEEVKKKSSGLPSSSLPVTVPSSGGATSASNKGLTGLETATVQDPVSPM